MNRLTSPLPLLAAALAVSSACTGSPEVDTVARDSAIYGAVVADVVEDAAPEPDTETDRLPVLFVESFDDETIALEVQVELVNSFVDRYELRFIDTFDEAVDLELPSHPVPPASLLIGLGPIVGDDDVWVRTELYRDASDVSAFRYTLDRVDGEWVVVAEPEQIEPEGFVTP